MSYYFHAVAVDYDGTLTEQRRPAAEVLAALRAVRAGGRMVVLVTGRIPSDLRADFPEVDEHFDAIVAENGAVLCRPGSGDRPIATPVDPALEEAIRARGIPVTRGLVLVATDARWGDAVNEEIARLGLEVQIIRNRGALMVLPTGVTKGTGVSRVLEELGLSRHSAVGIGDAENDHSLLAACEVGVAVANAIPSLEARADVVLATADGRGVSEFLLGPFLAGLPGLEPRHWRVTLGREPDGTPVAIPASGVNIEIYGATGTGKSYLAGLIAEQLIDMRYLLCVIDLEGDHVPLAEAYGVVALGGREALPTPREAAALIADGVSIIVDLSMCTEERKQEYGAALLDALQRVREDVGLPHWIVVEEAHIPLPAGQEGWWCREPLQKGICIVSYRPELVCGHLTARADLAITMESNTRALVTMRRTGETRTFTPAERATSHVRHWHKYSEGKLPRHRSFFFRDAHGLTGQVAGNMPEFLAVIRHARPEVLRHHASGGDFSRWLGDLLQSPGTAGAVSEYEREVAIDDDPQAVRSFRSALESIIAERFERQESASRATRGAGRRP